MTSNINYSSPQRPKNGRYPSQQGLNETGNIVNSQQNMFQSNISPNKNAISRLESQNPFGGEYNEIVSLQVNPRITYLRKFYLALSCQLFFIGFFAYLVHTSQSLRDVLTQNMAIFWMSLIGSIMISIFGLCFRKRIRTSPMNLLCLIMWTIFFGMVLIYGLSIANHPLIGVMSFSLFGALILSQFLYTLTVRYELTYQGSTLFVIGTSLIFFHIFTLFTTFSFFQILAISFFSLLFIFYLIFDTQSRIAAPEYDFNTEEWKSGCVLVYVDVFLLILRIGDLVTILLVKDNE